MWNMIHTSSSFPYDKHEGDRQDATLARPDQTFEPIVIEVTVFKGEATVVVKTSRLASTNDSALAVRVEQVIRKLFQKKQKPQEKNPEQKKLDDGKTIDI